jgi:hypothetical protein
LEVLLQLVFFLAFYFNRLHNLFIKAGLVLRFFVK